METKAVHLDFEPMSEKEIRKDIKARGYNESINNMCRIISQESDIISWAVRTLAQRMRYSGEHSEQHIRQIIDAVKREVMKNIPAGSDVTE